jgi:hypothetical protein
VQIAPADLRSVRQDGLNIRFALLGPMAFVFGEIPASGSSGTSMERPCMRPHWGFVVEGGLTFVSGSVRERIPAGSAFHVAPGGPEHHFEAQRAGMVAGFQPTEATTQVDDQSLVAQGFELVELPTPPTVVPVIAARRISPGQVRAEAWEMSGYVMSRVRMGERSGYSTSWCDAPHWGLVTDGRLTIEWEDDVQVLGSGEIFYCPAGPPGHRIEAADPATFVDLTPSELLGTSGRLADWRRALDVHARSTGQRIGVALR